MTVFTSVVCQECGSVWSLTGAKEEQRIKSRIVERLTLLKCPLCGGLASKVLEEELK